MKEIILRLSQNRDQFQNKLDLVKVSLLVLLFVLAILGSIASGWLFTKEIIICGTIVLALAVIGKSNF